jgi:predicted Zn-ribbon and HTH transcriptional regulator
MVRIVIPRAHCEGCGHSWVPRVENPRMCPKCRKVNYDRPRKVKSIADESQK